jgi:hypothetical protein
MKLSLVLLAAAALLASPLVGTPAAPLAPAVSSERAAPASQAAPSLLRLPPAARAGEVVYYGHIRSLVRKGPRLELRFDPAWWLGGVTAKRAKLEDTGSSDVENDYYIVEEGHRLLTFLVPLHARATVLTQGLRTIAIPASELAQLLQGKNPKQRRLFDRTFSLGFWIRVATDTVRSLDQQYQP